jgi:signal transduction histidine kinase
VYVRPVMGLRTFAGRHGLDLVIVLLALEAVLEVLTRSDAPDAPTTTPALAAAAVALVVLPLLGRRRAPFLAPAALWPAAAALSFADGRLVVFPIGVNAAGLVSAFLLGRLRDEAQAWIGLAIVVACAAIVMVNDPDSSAGEVVLLPAMFALAWLAGFALRGHAAQAEAAEERALHAERERAAAARIAVAEERARIARELHDIVAHSVSVMVLQAGAVRHRLPSTQSEAADALRSVEQTGRSALAEMRRLLGAMRRDDEDAALAPQPGLGGLDHLLHDVRRAGLPVDLDVEGEPFPLPGGIDLSAYRIVQEGLTNTLKHADASRAHVVLRYDADALRIDVRDDGRGSAGGDGLGHGLVGVRERVKLYGGEMTARTANGGGFVLSTRLPVTGDRA